MRTAAIRKSRSVGKSEAAVRACRVCGCTDFQACQGGCWRVAADLCSTCDSDRVDGTGESDSKRRLYSIEEPGLALVLNYALQLMQDPALHGRLNEAVALMIRPGSMSFDASGELGDEKVMEVMLTRTQLREILDSADEMWFDDCAACGWNPRTGEPLNRLSPWRVWAYGRRLTWSNSAPVWTARLQASLDRLTTRLGRKAVQTN